MIMALCQTALWSRSIIFHRSPSLSQLRWMRNLIYSLEDVHNFQYKCIMCSRYWPTFIFAISLVCVDGLLHFSHLQSETISASIQKWNPPPQLDVVCCITQQNTMSHLKIRIIWVVIEDKSYGYCEFTWCGQNEQICTPSQNAWCRPTSGLSSSTILFYFLNINSC